MQEEREFAGSAVNSFAMTGGRLLPEAFLALSHRPYGICEIGMVGYRAGGFPCGLSGPFKHGDDRLSLGADLHKQGMLVAELLLIAPKFPKVDLSVNAAR